MKIGKLPEHILRRSVLKQVKHRREEVLMGPAVGGDCACLALQEGDVLALTTDPITGTAEEMGAYGIYNAANDLAAAGAEPVAVLVTMLLPEKCSEKALKKLTEEVERTCAMLQMEVIGGHTEVTPAVRQPILSVTGVGKLAKGRSQQSGGLRPGQDLVLSKWIGLEGTVILAKEREKALRQVFAEPFIRIARNFREHLSVVPESRIAMDFGVSAMHDVAEGGIFGALWELAEGAGVGLDIDLKKIPIRQETIEICECLGLNPYLLLSGGAMLMAAAEGEGLVRALQEAGISAAVIGQATEGNDRILRNGEEIRYLDRPQSDEIYKLRQ